MTYNEKLQDPRWQKKKNEILRRDKFVCKSCFDKTTNLQVHHIKYIFGAEPWEYENKNLITLCKVCHKDVTEYKKFIKDCIDNKFVTSYKLYEVGLIINIAKDLTTCELQQLLKRAETILKSKQKRKSNG